MSDPRIIVSYQLPASGDYRRYADMIAVGQTTGSWGAAFPEYQAQMAAYRAEVLNVEQVNEHHAIANIAFPAHNTESDIPSLLTAVFGKFSLAGPARIKTIKLPPGYGINAKFGIQGIRQATGVHHRPLFMGIFKPALGLTAAHHAQLLEQVAGAGLDMIKDDEIMFNLASAPTLERVKACQPILEKMADRHGRTMLYLVNLSGRADQLVDNARRLIDAGANALLFNVFAYGFSALEALTGHPDVSVPVFTHPALAGALGGPATGTSDYGIDYAVLLGTLQKYAGADGVLYPASYGSLPFDPVTEEEIRDILRDEQESRTPAMPVPSAGIHPGITRKAYHDYGNDVVLNAGSAVFDHPGGPTAGVQAFTDAWQLAEQDRAITIEHATTDALRAALQKWGEET